MGSEVGWGEENVRLRTGGILPSIFEAGSQLKLARLTFDVERYVRDDNFYPTTGSLSTGTLIYGRSVDSGERHYGKAVFATNRY